MKTTVEQIEKGQEFMDTLVQKAWESEAFKKQLVNDPIAAIESVTGKAMHIPAGKKVVVRDQTAKDVVYINIPAKLNTDELELTDEQLEAVAGGATSYDGWNPIIWAGIGARELWNWATD